MISMDMYELLERYEALGELDDYLAAKALFERAIAGQPTGLVLRQYGYLLECHGRITIRRAIEQYERSMVLDLGESTPAPSCWSGKDGWARRPRAGATSSEMPRPTAGN